MIHRCVPGPRPPVARVVHDRPPRVSRRPEKIQPTVRRRRRTQRVCGSSTVSVTATGRRPIPDIGSRPPTRGRVLRDRHHRTRRHPGGSDPQRRYLGAPACPSCQAMASELGVKGTSKMRKGDLVQAISDARAGSARRRSSRAAPRPWRSPTPRRAARAPRARRRSSTSAASARSRRRPVRAPRGDALAGLEAPGRQARARRAP